MLRLLFALPRLRSKPMLATLTPAALLATGAVLRDVGNAHRAYEHMLSKILGIRNIGRIESKAAVDLHRLTVIYGDNGRGKTTLSAILRSLSTGDAAHIMERRTLLSANEPAVTVKSDSFKAPLAFKKGVWSQTMPYVEIFDARFVSANVYAGNSVEHDQKRQLHHFVMGAEGVALAHAVDAYDSAIRVINTQIQVAEERIRSYFADAQGSGLDVGGFIGLVHDAEVVSRIETQKQRVDAARKAGALSSKASLTAPTLPPFDRSEIDALLSLTLSDVAAGAETMTRLHADHCLGPKSSEWLAAGVQYLDARSAARGQGQAGCGLAGHDAPASEPCPFCGAATEANTLVSAYRDFFSESYRNLSLQIGQATAETEQLFGEGTRTTVQHVVEQNTLLAESWGPYGVGFSATLDVGSLLSAHHDVGSRLLSRLAAKRAAPLDACALDESDEAALRVFSDALTELDVYEAAVAVANADISRVKVAAGSANLADEEKHLWELICRQRRHNPNAVVECERYAELLHQKTEAEAAKLAARSSLDSHAKAVFTTYQASINKHLNNCGCGYGIGGTKVNYTGGKPSTEYHLTITGTTIPLSPNKKDPLAPSFGNTLSEGDKSTLAFAFFLSRLEMDPALADKVVVFDDPITSQDNHRRAWTRKQILRIADGCKQVIVLTHDALFARQLWEDAHIACHTLQLERDGERSVIVPWAIEQATEIDYFRHHRTLLDYVDEGAKGRDLRVIAQSIRPMLEGNLRMRFPEHFGQRQWLGGFLKLVREAEGTHPLQDMQAHLEPLEEICSFSNRYHHDQNPGWAAEPVGDGELTAYARRALVAARGGATPTE